MGYNWSRNDKKNWESNEVLMEFEKRLVRAAFELEKRITAQTTDQKKKDLESLQETIETTDEAAKNLNSTLENAIYDDKEVELTEEELEAQAAAAKDQLLKELDTLLKEAISKRDIKLAYKIERTIDEIRFEN